MKNKWVKWEKNFKIAGGATNTNCIIIEFLKSFYFLKCFSHFIGRQIPISPSVDRLFPAIEMFDVLSLEANFGDDPAKPFKFDVELSIRYLSSPRSLT
jgi:hypothetical protein